MEKYMKRAVELAELAGSMGEIPVGAVVVKRETGEIIAEGYNRRESDKNALAHAELIAINEACRKLGGWRLIGCDLYVTLEPCPMCAGAIINSRIKRVIYGCKDYKAGSCTSVINLFDLPYNHRPECIGGILENECSAMLSDFFRNLRKRKNAEKKPPD